MRKYTFLVLLTVLIMSFSTFSQENDYASSRLTGLSNRLKGYTVDLADRTYNNIRNGYSASRSELEAVFLAQQLDASAGLFQQMVRDNRRASELRDAASILSDLSRRAPTYGYDSNYWRDVKNTIDDINRELGGNGGGWNPGGGNGENQNVLGRINWRGTVDKEVHLVIRNNTLNVRLFDGTDYGSGTHNFTAPLPNRNVNVNVNKKKGRGSVTVIQQPDRYNDYTAVIKILDTAGGAKDYEVEVYWTK